MKVNSLKGFFVCEQCRKSCKNGCDDVGPYGPDRCVDAYFPRKQYIRCLGKYCDTPCKFQQDESSLKMEQLINLVKYLTLELNKHLIKN